MNETKTKKLSHGEALIAFAAGLAVVFAVSLQLIRNSVHQKQKTDEESASNGGEKGRSGRANTEKQSDKRAKLKA